jgi:hypothetical protein
MQIYEKTQAASQMDHDKFVLGEECFKDAWLLRGQTRLRWLSGQRMRLSVAPSPGRAVQLRDCVHSLEDQVKPSTLSEGLEVTVSGDKRYSAIDTALGDERVTKTCLALLCQHLSS